MLFKSRLGAELNSTKAWLSSEICGPSLCSLSFHEIFDVCGFVAECCMEAIHAPIKFCECNDILFIVTDSLNVLDFSLGQRDGKGPEWNIWLKAGWTGFWFRFCRTTFF